MGTCVGVVTLAAMNDPYAKNRAQWERPYDMEVYLRCVEAFAPQGMWSANDAHVRCRSAAQADYAARTGELP